MLTRTIRVLIIEDDERWYGAISGYVAAIAIESPHLAFSYEHALERVHNDSYDLLIMDLSIPQSENNKTNKHPDWGLALLHEVRREGSQNETCAILIVSGNVTIPKVKEALERYKINDIYEKDEGFDEDALLKRAGNAVSKARIKQADLKAKRRYHLTIRFDEQHLLGSELVSADRKSTHNRNISSFEVEDMVRRADLLNWLIVAGGVEVWCPEANSIGRAIYQALSAERMVLGDLIAARALAKLSDQVCIQFSGPAKGLGIPFELLRDEHNESLVRQHVITRQLTHLAGGYSRKADAFHQFVKRALRNDEELRILIVGANSDSRIEGAEMEAEYLHRELESILGFLNIRHKILPLTGQKANYQNVAQHLQAGDYHIFHYAGHGRYDEKSPEHSGLVLRDGRTISVLAASTLSSYAKNKRLQLVFLSSCTSARTAARAGRGDFHSVFEALAKADVPTVIGYRWAVADKPALLLAMEFYRALWHTLSPGEAMLKARQAAANGPHGNDDDTWASPVLLMQNP